jgi:peptide-methionine (R)-S-oxide reductase
MIHHSLPHFALSLFTCALLTSCQAQTETSPNHKATSLVDSSMSVTKSESEWREELPHMACFVLREKGTERAFSGEFWDHHDPGMYCCAGCGQGLFDADHKFESGTGWPSFFQPAEGTSVLEESDDSWGMKRVEVMCSACGGHLGHVFDDGPEPTGLRYCINSAALSFVKADSSAAQGVQYD